jgi:hypothetical protein
MKMEVRLSGETGRTAQAEQRALGHLLSALDT